MFHEIAHALVALWLGDRTSKELGRITLNPIVHIDLLGSIIIPIASFLIFGFTLGWAKPVPYNPNNLKNRKLGEILIALAGPVSNFLQAIISALLAMYVPISVSFKRTIASDVLGFDWSQLVNDISGNTWAIIFAILSMFIFWNALFGVYNLIPIPPLDGSKVLYNVFNLSEKVKFFLERWGMIILFVIIMIPMFRVFLDIAFNFFFVLFFTIAFH